MCFNRKWDVNTAPKDPGKLTSRGRICARLRWAGSEAESPVHSCSPTPPPSSSRRGFSSQQSTSAQKYSWKTPPHLISSHRPCVISHNLKKMGESSTVRYLERKRDHIHITVVTVYCYSGSLLLLAVVVNLLVGLMHKLSERHVWIGKLQYMQGLILSAASGIHWGSRNIFSVSWGWGLLYLSMTHRDGTPSVQGHEFKEQ